MKRQLRTLSVLGVSALDNAELSEVSPLSTCLLSFIELKPDRFLERSDVFKLTENNYAKHIKLFKAQYLLGKVLNGIIEK